MKNLLVKGSVELVAVVLGITLSLWVNDNAEKNAVKKTNKDTLGSMKNEISLRIKYIDRKIEQYARDIEIGDFITNRWGDIDIDSLLIMTKDDRNLILTLKAYRAINLPVSIYNSLNSDGSIGRLEQNPAKIEINYLYEVMPAHITDGVENERDLYQRYNEYIIKNYPSLIDNIGSKAKREDLTRFFNDPINYGFISEKTHIRKFILRLISRYNDRLIDLEKLL